MKKILALALAVAMIMAIVPAALAAPAVEDTSDRFSNMTNGLPETNKTAGSRGEINEKYLKATESVNLTDTKESYSEIGTIGFEEIDVELADTTGYWLSGDDFHVVDDLYTDGREVYVQRFSTLSGDSLKPYAEGETVWFNYDFNSSFTDGTFVNLPENEDGYYVEVICLAGTLNDDGETISLSSVGTYSSYEAGISVKLTAYEDDTYFMFVVIFDEVDTLEADEFGAWITISSLPNEASFKGMKKGADMTVGTPATTNIGSSDTSMVIAPTLATMYSVTYVQAHKIELEGNKPYVLSFNSEDEIGLRMWFCDENLDVINDSYMPAEALGEYDYSDVAIPVWPTESGTYYMVIGGYWMTDEGSAEISVVEWEDFEGTYELSYVDNEIDLSALGEQQNYISDDESWGYHWFSEDGVGMLILAAAGTYTLKGEASDVFLDVYDGVRVVYDNATTGAVMLSNGFAPVSIESKGKALIADNNVWGYAVFNSSAVYPGGLYVMGEEFTVEGIFGFVMEGAPLHLCAKKLVVETTSMEGYYPIAMWVAGINQPAVTFGGNAKLDGENKLTKLFYDVDGRYFYGYAISAYDELYRPEEASGWDLAALSFELTTDGTIGGGASGASMLGDANNDGKVNTGDATAILRHAASIAALEGQGLVNADVNQDGKVNTGDATKVLRIAAGLEPQP